VLLKRFPCKVRSPCRQATHRDPPEFQSYFNSLSCASTDRINPRRIILDFVIGVLTKNAPLTALIPASKMPAGMQARGSPWIDHWADKSAPLAGLG
jgi:hypothetical protein